MRRRRQNAEAKGHAFKEKVRQWARRIRVQPTQLRIQSMSRKWASCSTRGWLTFSEDLLSQPKPFQEYVIVHELLHLRVPNHGKLFKSLLTAYVPGWRKLAQARGLNR